MNWINSKKKSTYVIISVLVASYLSVTIFSGVAWVAVIALSASIVCPFALFLVWVVDTALIEKLLERRWTAILIAGVIVVYGMFANSFASEMINQIFMVDPEHFVVTSVFLTAVYLLVGLFAPFFVLPAYLVAIFSGLIALPAFFMLGSNKQALTRVLLWLFTVFIISTTAQMYGLFKYQLPQLAETVALWSDFNEHHRCDATWQVSVDKVIFLENGKVLGHIQNTRDYVVLPCY